jgi:hypothetical protein
MRFAKMSRLQVANLTVEIKADKKVGQLRGMNDYRADGKKVERHAEDHGVPNHRSKRSG